MTTAERRPRVIGRQLRSARELLGLTREAAAASLGVSEAEIDTWESDTAELSVETLWEIADLYHRAVDYFLKPVPEGPRQINYRLVGRKSLDELAPESREVIAQFDELCRWRHELDVLSNEPRRPLLPRITKELHPEEAAASERERLGLGQRPVRQLRGLLEKQGVRVFELPVPGGEFAGFSWWSNEYGPCVLVNAADPYGRRNFTLAHEYAHLLLSGKPTVCDLNDETIEERFANRFAAAFLMPEADVRHYALSRSFVDVVPGAEELRPLASRYAVSLEAMGRRLEDLGLIPKGATDSRLDEWQRTMAFPRRARRPTWRRRLGESYVRSAFTAHSSGLISLSRLAQLLGLEIRKAQDAYRKDAEERERASH